ncbi:MAG: D-cysteine desulfhydrase family protein [Deltaproteobacteria bacterium]|nr:D-cysteine desulfhydrase family protein [Deltaproteobacteria bacterium]
MPDRISLANLPTPIQPLSRLGRAFGIDLSVKRDDLTGGADSGNKLRKLELLAADAVAQGADTLVTCGGIQSNHCRATAVVAARLGLRSMLLLRTAEVDRDPGYEGNVLVDRILGARIRLVTPEEYARRAEVMAEVGAELRSEGRKPYLIPEGGSNALGALGYLSCCDEIARQSAERWDTIAYACGSGGTGAGLEMGVRQYLEGTRPIGFAVCDDASYFAGVISRLAAEAHDRFGAPEVPRAEIRIDDRYKGVGYAKSRPEELVRIREAARAEGLVTDPVYTGKALHGLLCELERDPRAFGRRVLFIFTGGLYGLFAAGESFRGLLPPSF